MTVAARLYFSTKEVIRMFNVLASRITVFALACIWVLGLLLTGIVTFPTFLLVVGSHVAHPVLVSFIVFWYLATLVLVGLWVAVKGFKFVGKWERRED